MRHLLFFFMCDFILIKGNINHPWCGPSNVGSTMERYNANPDRSRISPLCQDGEI